MSRLAGSRRSTLVLTCVALATAVLGSTAAGAAPAVSIDPATTWGTAGGSEGKAQLVLAIAEVGGRVYLGGEFDKLVPPGGGGSQTRHHLAAIDVGSGDLTPWDPGADGTVRAMVVSGNRLYVGGDFRRVGGQSARNLAAINLATGEVDSGFHPTVGGRVRSLALDGDRLYLGGDFGSVGGVKRPKVAAVDAGTGAVLNWTPPALGRGRYTGQTGKRTHGASSGNVYSVAVSGGGVYVAGNFTDFAGQGGLLALDAGTGRPLSQQWEVGGRSSPWPPHRAGGPSSPPPVGPAGASTPSGPIAANRCGWSRWTGMPWGWPPRARPSTSPATTTTS